ncbi:MAG: pilus assembly protein N-terminal domain-containing protein [Pseudolabrys sp.]|nr:pilus assembly protein N-terminal domain-containing protein [Pseudolabrys sp.]
MPVSRLKVALAAFAAFCASSAAHADTVTVRVDQAQILKLPDRVSTIVIGNPLIADATLQAGGILVVTGKGYGATNLLALDRQGRIVMDKTVQVARSGQSDVITVYKGIARESYSCAPDCGPRITLGDGSQFFTDALGQTTTRNGGAGAK